MLKLINSLYILNDKINFFFGGSYLSRFSMSGWAHSVSMVTPVGIKPTITPYNRESISVLHQLL